MPKRERIIDLMVRSMHTDQFNRHPAQLTPLAGRSFFGLPTVGSWVTYGPGTESANLPRHVVLSAGRDDTRGSPPTARSPGGSSSGACGS